MRLRSNLKEIGTLPGFIIRGKKWKKFAGTSRECSRRNREEEETINCKKRYNVAVMKKKGQRFKLRIIEFNMKTVKQFKYR